MIASYPVGGVFWDYAQYAMGLERLGFEVYYLEDTGWEAYDPATGSYGTDYTYGVTFLKESLETLSRTLLDRWHVRGMDGTIYGMTEIEMIEVVAEADLFLNVSGSCLLRDAYLLSRRKAIIDTDPGWNHFVNYPNWDANPGWQESHGFRAHDYFFTYAERIGQSDCVLPDFGLDWRPTRPPVVLDYWQSAPPGETWTTVMTWDNFRRPIDFGGRTYGTKELEFVKVEALPRDVRSMMEIAVGGATAPRDRLRSAGWSVIEAKDVSRTAETYRTYIEQSRGECSVAKNVYVATKSGWFSCRSVCYLAAGRPVVVQDTGFSEFLPVGDGLLAFATLDDAVERIAAVEADYAAHSAAAREVARSAFASDRVLGELLREVGL